MDIKLWKYNKFTGYWNCIKSVIEEEATQWLQIFQKGEPQEEFKLSRIRPKYIPKNSRKDG